MAARLKTLAYILLITLLPTFLLWLPFVLKLKNFWGIPLPTAGMATIVSNYDGPLFLVVAKTLYNPSLIRTNFSFPLRVEYYASHFPLFPFLIRLVSPITGFPYGMLFVTILFAAVALYYFYKLTKEFVDAQNALWLTFVFSVFPARWLVVRSVGSAETLFLAGIIASVYYFNKKNYLLAGICGAVAGLTKSPGILLFMAYGLALGFPFFKNIAQTSLNTFTKKINVLTILPLFLIPFSLFLVFFIYKLTYGDFFVYFKSGDNIHLFFPPFQVFNYTQPWVGTYWLEEVIFVYLLAIMGIYKLYEKKLYNFTWVAGVFFLTIFFVSHRDIVRYALPAIPFILLGYSDILVKKEFKVVLIFLLIPIYLFSLAFISQNVMPISDWGPFL